MDYLLPVLSLILLSIAVSHANLQALAYWITVLPNTAMPSAITNLLHPDESNDGKSKISVNLDKGGVSVDTVYKKPGDGTNVIGPVQFPLSVNYGHGSAVQSHDDPMATLFFLKKDLHTGVKMNLHFPRATNVTNFLPRRAAENIPFSSEKAPEILSKFSIEPSSVEAEAMKMTIKECEEPAAEGEQKVCATSLESMVDFSMTSLGTRDLVAASTTAGPGAEKEHEYTIAGVGELARSELVACHLVPYVYAVFYCHKTQKTVAYNVEMVGKNGAKVEAVAVCHTDTAAWNPAHVAFKVLKMKPGTVPVCHFVTHDHVVWAYRKILVLMDG